MTGWAYEVWCQWAWWVAGLVDAVEYAARPHAHTLLAGVFITYLLAAFLSARD